MICWQNLPPMREDTYSPSLPCCRAKAWNTTLAKERKGTSPRVLLGKVVLTERQA